MFNRRLFLKTSGLAAGALVLPELIPSLLQAQGVNTVLPTVSPTPADLDRLLDNGANVIVVGATPAGIAAAIAAAQGGADVLLIEETRHVGGIVSAGLTTADIGKNAAVGGLFNEFRNRICTFYITKYGEDSEQVKDCRDGNSSEAYVAEQIFRDMLATQPSVRLVTEHYLERAHVRNNRIEAIVIRHVNGGSPRTLPGTVFIDATYEGDLAAAAGVQYRVGREGGSVYGESLAGRIYTKIGNRERLLGSTGEGDAGIQAYCFRIHITAEPTNRVPFTKPMGYQRSDYKYLLADIKEGRIKRFTQVVQFKKIPNKKFELNSDHLDWDRGGPSESFDLAEENWGWPEASREERKRIFVRYQSYQQGLLWFLQTDSEVPEALRKEVAQYGLCRDEFVDNNHWPHLIYVRQGRRMHGEYTLTQRSEEPDPIMGLPSLHPDSVAIGSYSWDSHAVHKYDPAFPRAREGYFVASHPPVPIPFGVVVPKTIDGLLVPVACSASHVAYAAVRMEPVFMALGQASGIAAAKAVRVGIQVRNIPVSQIQAELTRQGCVISYFEDVPQTHPAFPSIQFLGPRGLSQSFYAMPYHVMAPDDVSVRLTRIFKVANVLIPADLKNSLLQRKNLTVADFAVAVTEVLATSV